MSPFSPLPRSKLQDSLTDAGAGPAVRGWIRLHRTDAEVIDDEQCTPVLVPTAHPPTRHRARVPVLALC